MRIYSKTDVGAVRKSNQDAYAAGELKNGMVWAVVCDGMGGVNGGEIAGTSAVKTVSDYILTSYQTGMTETSVKNLLLSAVETANITVYDLANSNPDLKGMGTTVVAAIVVDGKVHIVHAGDSRAYVIRGGTALQITRDHSVVQNMIESGKITEAEAKLHPDKNVITRALGVAETVKSEYDSLSFSDGDVLLICTDGLTNFVDIKTVESIIADGHLSDAPEKLIDAAIENGGGDNITAVVIS